MKKASSNRREFLSTTAKVAGAITAAGTALNPCDQQTSAQDQTGTLSQQRIGPNDQLTLGVIGIGPRCRYDLAAMLKFDDIRCIAIADVQASRRDTGKKLVDSHYGNSNCDLHNDFRELLDRKEIDAVLIATGDRWHGLASMMAAEAGKDIYSEKPCGITIETCQKLDETIRRTGRVFQAGTQRRSVRNFRQAVELVHTGKIGKMHTMHASVYMPELDNTWLPAEPLPARDVVDWNLWLGPAPWRPFNQKYVAGRWRGQWDFDSGARLLDWGAHTVDICQWANQADDTLPITYEPMADKIVCNYANGVKLVIDFLPEPFGDRSPQYITRLGTCPVRLIGDQGWVETGDSGEVVIQPTGLVEQPPTPTKRAPGLEVSAHSRNFFDCVRSRGKPVANSQVMRRSHIACHAAAIAWILNRKLEIDPATETFVNDPEANLLATRPDRQWAT